MLVVQGKVGRFVHFDGFDDQRKGTAPSFSGDVGLLSVYPWYSEDERIETGKRASELGRGDRFRNDESGRHGDR